MRSPSSVPGTGEGNDRRERLRLPRLQLASNCPPRDPAAPSDDLGEATLLAFSLGQFGGRAQALLTLGAALDCARARGWRFLRYDFQAWQRGRRATSLVTLPWEELLPLRLDTVRHLAGVAGADEAHPEGILRGRIVDRARH